MLFMEPEAASPGHHRTTNIHVASFAISWIIPLRRNSYCPEGTIPLMGIDIMKEPVVATQADALLMEAMAGSCLNNSLPPKAKRLSRRRRPSRQWIDDKAPSANK